MAVKKDLLGLHQELERGFTFWNRRCFRGELPPVVFAFFPQPSNGRESRLGHYLPGSWTVGSGQRAAEIVFYADLCLKAGPKEVLLTLVHEMVHHWQHLHGRPGKKVHNAEWHAKAAACGLVTAGPNGATVAGPDFNAAAKAFGLRVEHIPFRGMVAGRKRQKGKMRRWSCPLECNGSIRAGKSQVYLTCGVCGDLLMPDDQGAEEGDSAERAA